MQLVRPGPEHLASYVAALERGWSDNERGIEAAREELAHIHADAAAFLGSMEDREGKGPPITLPDGSAAKRLPGVRRWLWAGEFCGSIGLRWQPGSTALPPYCLGHIGYAVVPWKQGLGYAKSALRLILPEARAVGLPYVEITTDPDNIASRRVIEANGGILVEHFIKPPQFGGRPGLRFRITLHDGAMLVTVTKTYTAQYSDPICFDAGETVQVERGDAEYPGWYWCRAASGREGWVHRSFLAACEGTTTSVRAYSATELTVAGGERGALLQLLDGWACVRLDTGEVGWIPESHVSLTAAD